MIEGRQPSHGTPAVGDDHLFAFLDATQVPAEVVLEIPYSDLDTRCSYRHAATVATSPADRYSPPRSSDRCLGGLAEELVDNGWALRDSNPRPPPCKGSIL